MRGEIWSVLYKKRVSCTGWGEWEEDEEEERQEEEQEEEETIEQGVQLQEGIDKGKEETEMIE